MRAELKSFPHEQYYFRLRLGFTAFVVLGLFGILAMRFSYLQIKQYAHYQTLAENNRISLVPVVANRGLILDKNGVVLAHNFFVYTLEITPSKVDDLEATIAEVAKLVEISKLDRKRFNKLQSESRNFESIPIRTHLNEVEAASFAVNHYRFPGVEIKSRLFRHYPLGKLGAHMIGYIGRINDNDMVNLEICPITKGLTMWGKVVLSSFMSTNYMALRASNKLKLMQMDAQFGWYLALHRCLAATLLCR